MPGLPYAYAFLKLCKHRQVCFRLAWLDISALEAFLANLGLLVFFFVYAVVFTWGFDRVFGLPESAAMGEETPKPPH